MSKFKSSLDPLPVIANRRIDTLLAFAKSEVRAHPDLAKRYVKLARAIAMRHRVPLGRGRKHLFCQECNLPWVVGYNVKVRLEPKTRRMIYSCKCGKRTAFVYSKKRAK